LTNQNVCANIWVNGRPDGPRDYVEALVCDMSSVERESHLLIMLNAYIDDSGKEQDPNNSVMVLSGYVFTAHKAGLFCDAWAEVLRRYGFDYIHVREALKRDRIFKGRSFEEIHACLNECANVINAHAEFPISCVLHKDTWARAQVLIEQYKLIDYGCVYYKHPYFLLYMTIIQILHDYRLKKHIRDDATFIFDKQDVNLKQVAELYFHLANAAPDILKAIHMSNDPPEFKDDLKVTPLQAADMIAWTFRRQHDSAAKTYRLNPFEEILRAKIGWQVIFDDYTLIDMKLKAVEIPLVTAERQAPDGLVARRLLGEAGKKAYERYITESSESFHTS